jgi:hypothetical protein
MDGWMDGAGVVFLSLCATIFLFFCFLMMSQLRNGLYTSEIFKIK